MLNHGLNVLKTRRALLCAAILASAAMFAGAVSRAQDRAARNLSLSLSEAIQLAIDNNVHTLNAKERILEAEGERGIVRSALLPSVSAAASQTNLTSNLAAWGMPVQDLKGFPAFVGPFNRFDARLSLMQSVFNLASIRKYQASGLGVAIASEQQQLAVQQTTTAAILAYLRVLEAEQSLTAARANVEQAEKLLDLASAQRSAGVATGIDVARAETRVANQRVRAEQTQTGLDEARFILLRVAGLPLSTVLVLSERMRLESETVDLSHAVARAFSDRIELRLADRQVQIQEMQQKAASALRLPTLTAFGDYGSSGLTPGEMDRPTRSAGIQLNFPVFEGGRIRSEIRVASSRLKQAETERNDLRAEVEKEVRLALQNLGTREQQAQASDREMKLATRELDLARDRFRNGVADNIEVINAQTALENARLSFVSSLAQFNIARVNLAVAMGHPEEFHF